MKATEMNATKRWLTMVAVVISLASLTGCDCSGHCDASRTGMVGGCCDPSSGCGTNGVCVETTCQSCGGSGDRCCLDSSGFGTCPTAGLACVMPASGAQTCQACGQDGQQCCDSMGMAPCSNSGSACLSGTCTSGVTACNLTGAPVGVGVVDANHCALRTITVDAPDFSSAQMCAATMLNGGESVETSGAVGDPIEFDLCIVGSMGTSPMPIRAYSMFEAIQCACQGVRTCLAHAC